MPLPPGMKPDRSALVLVLGLGGLFVTMFGCLMCGPFAIFGMGLSIPAIVMARRDLEEIRGGTMSPLGEGTTRAGMIVAIVATVLSAIVGIVMIVLFLLYGGLIAAAIASGGH